MYDWKNLHRICPSLVFGNVELDRFEVTTAWRHQKPPPTEFQLGSNVQSKTHFRLLLWKARKILSEENHPSVIAQKKHIKDHFQDRVHGMEPIKIFFNWSKALEAQSSSCHNYFLKIGHSQHPFQYFHFFYLTAQRSDNLLQMLRFDTRISGVVSDRSANWATNTVLLLQLFFLRSAVSVLQIQLSRRSGCNYNLFVLAYTKMLVASGSASYVEVLDLSSNQTGCANLLQFPNSLLDQIGGLSYAKEPVICGSSITTCWSYVKGAWSSFAGMNYPRLDVSLYSIFFFTNFKYSRPPAKIQSSFPG